MIVKLLSSEYACPLIGITVVSWASAHSRVRAHVPSFKGSLLQLPYKHMEFINEASSFWVLSFFSKSCIGVLIEVGVGSYCRSANVLINRGVPL